MTVQIKSVLQVTQASTKTHFFGGSCSLSIQTDSSLSTSLKKGDVMYTRDQLNQSMQKIAENRKTYTEDSIDEARAKLQEVSDTLAHVEKGGTSIYRHDQLLRMEEEAQQELEDALKYAGPLAARKRAREFAEKREAEKKQSQQEHAASEKAAYRIEAKAKWLAVGGSEHAFNENFESMWTTEVMKRTQGPDLKEQTKQRLAKTGRYSL